MSQAIEPLFALAVQLLDPLPDQASFEQWRKECTLCGNLVATIQAQSMRYDNYGIGGRVGEIIYSACTPEEMQQAFRPYLPPREDWAHYARLLGVSMHRVLRLLESMDHA